MQPTGEASNTDLARDSPDTIRTILSQKLNDIIATCTTENVYKEFREFTSSNRYAVHNSFFRDMSDEFSTWFGYKLQFPSIGRGNFGEVYSATDRNGSPVAVKIMNESIFDNDEMLGGFRRGVRSMAIVRDSELPGMVSLIESFELPPTIVMPLISGASLEEALKIQRTIGWRTKLLIAAKTARIISSAHSLTQTVLHRDIKPSNIMVRDFDYTDDFDPDIVVLDFDMSWHKGSSERDVVFESRDDFGYLAPEQTSKHSMFSAQSTRVDSYGFGMTLFSLFGNEAPRPNEPLSDLWYSRALRATGRGYDGDWISAPIRLARLIERSTRVEQIERIDFSSLTREIDDLYIAVEDYSNLVNIDMWGEEVLARLRSSIPYQWDDARGKGFIESPSGIRTELSTDLKSQTAFLSFSYLDSGSGDRGQLGGYLARTADRAELKLKTGGWSRVSREIVRGGFVIKCEASIALLIAEIGKLTQGAADALDAIRP